MIVDLSYSSLFTALHVKTCPVGCMGSLESDELYSYE